MGGLKTFLDTVAKPGKSQSMPELRGLRLCLRRISEPGTSQYKPGISVDYLVYSG